MHPLSSHPLGSTERFTLRHESGAEFDVLAGRGGSLVGWRVPQNGTVVDLLDGYSSAADLDERYHSSHCGARLSPFPNRVKDGRWQWRDKTYQLPKNFPWENGHAIHGLLFDLPWQQTDLTVKDGIVWLTLECDYTGSEPGFPMPFHATSRYGLSAEGFTVISSVQNTGKSDLPYGEGWHPYFRPGCSLDHAELQILGQVVRLEVDDRSIPNKVIVPDFDFAEPTALFSRSLNTCWKFIGLEPRDEVVLRNPATGLTIRYWQNSAHGEYRYIQLYTPPARESLAIEPMTCPPDVLNNHLGLVVLHPGETREWRFGATLEMS